MVSPREALAASLSPTEIVAKGLSACYKVFSEKDFVNFKNVPERNAWSIFWKLEPSDIHWHKDSRDNTGTVYNTIKHWIHWTRVDLANHMYIGISWNMEIFSLLLPGGFLSSQRPETRKASLTRVVSPSERLGSRVQESNISASFLVGFCIPNFYGKLKLKKCWDFFITWFITSIYGVFSPLTKMPIFFGAIVDLLLLQVVSTFSRYGSVASKRQPWSSVLAEMISWKRHDFLVETAWDCGMFGTGLNLDACLGL